MNQEAKALETDLEKNQLCENSLHESIVFQALQCLCGLCSFFPEESWVSADRRGEPWKMLGSSQSNSIRGRNGLLKHQEGKSFAAYQQLGPNDITRQNQRKWANQICIKALFVCLLRKLQFAFKLEVKKKSLWKILALIFCFFKLFSVTGADVKIKCLKCSQVTAY